MKTITYKFCDGTISQVEVSDELYIVHEQLVLEEKRNHKRETRRHVSLNYLNDKGIDFEDTYSDPLTALIKSESKVKVEKALAILSDKQRQLVKNVFFDGMTLTAIAKQEQVSQQAISKRMSVIYKKLKTIL